MLESMPETKEPEKHEPLTFSLHVPHPHHQTLWEALEEIEKLGDGHVKIAPDKKSFVAHNRDGSVIKCEVHGERILFTVLENPNGWTAKQFQDKATERKEELLAAKAKPSV